MSPCIDGTQAHVWNIEVPAGPKSLGVCRRCGAEGQFANYVEHIQFTVERDNLDRIMPWRDINFRTANRAFRR